MSFAITKTLVLDKVTKGAVRYSEVDARGDIITDYREAVIGTIYVRKSALNGDGVPHTISVTINKVE